jgi:hypothetical protein
VAGGKLQATSKEQHRKLGKTKKQSLNAAFTSWSHMVNPGNRKNLINYGPYVSACAILKIENTKNIVKNYKPFI